MSASRAIVSVDSSAGPAGPSTQQTGLMHPAIARTVANGERVGRDMVSPTTMTSGGYILHGPVVGAAREAR